MTMKAFVTAVSLGAFSTISHGSTPPAPATTPEASTAPAPSGVLGGALVGAAALKAVDNNTVSGKEVENAKEGVHHAKDSSKDGPKKDAGKRAGKSEDGPKKDAGKRAGKGEQRAKKGGGGSKRDSR